MITALVQFRLPEPVTPERARELFIGSAPNYRGVTGLVRKYYLLSEDGCEAGGVYLWSSRKQAEAFYTEDWHRLIEARFGAQPTLNYFSTPVVVDNVAGEVLDDG